MKLSGLFLLILFLLMHGVQAQPNLQPVNRKFSPVLQKNKALFSKNQQQIFWIVTSNTDSAKKYFSQKQLPLQVTGEYAGGLLIVKSNWQTIDSLTAALPFIRFVDIPRQPHEELAIGSYDISLNTINLVHSQFPQLNGTSMVVSVKENKPDTADIDFAGRYISTPLASSSITSHASIMATIIAGGENSFYTGGGAAPAAQLTSSNFINLLPDADNDYRQYGISVQNHSYGTGVENYYGADAAAYDASIINNPGLLHVFSAGNSGNLAGTGPYAGITNMANITGSFKMAKNIITAGATDSFGTAAFLSSKGPAYDGRIKPELVAFGQDGSSGAAALTSGAVLLLQQQYKNSHSGTLPAAALIKAALLNSADDNGPKGPDYQSGYGILNTYKALQTLTNGNYFAGSVAQGGTQTFSFTVPANTRLLKILLCWNDPAAAANAPKALINDLDLELVNNSTTQVWQPWVLSPAPIIDSLLLPAVRKKDTLNNVEQITIDNAAAGTYTIRVKGFAVTGNQPFFIAWQTDAADQFQWQFPVSTDYITGSNPNLLRWSSTFNNSTGVLEYSVNKGVTWQSLNNATPLNAHTTYWDAPDTFCTALLRMTINGQSFISDTFTISSPVPVKVGFNCPDSVMLYWNRATGVNAYNVYRLGDKYLQRLTTLTDTFFIIHQPGSFNWYTVAPVIDNREGLKAYTLNYKMQGVDCYLKTFLADLDDRGGTSPVARLTIEIGSFYNVKSLTVEKLTNGVFQSLQVIQPVNALDYLLFDNKLTDGTNTYRLKIELTNGLVIYSSPQSVYYFLTTRYIIFPNPAKATGSIQVFTKEEPANTNTQVILYNALGQKVLQYNLQETASSIPLNGLKGGIYFILILKNGKKDFAGRIMVQ